MPFRGDPNHNADSAAQGWPRKVTREHEKGRRLRLGLRVRLRVRRESFSPNRNPVQVTESVLSAGQPQECRLGARTASSAVSRVIGWRQGAASGSRGSCAATGSAGVPARPLKGRARVRRAAWRRTAGCAPSWPERCCGRGRPRSSPDSPTPFHRKRMPFAYPLSPTDYAFRPDAHPRLSCGDGRLPTPEHSCR